MNDVENTTPETRTSKASTLAEITVKSDLLKAARYCQGDQDYRPYLNGICLAKSGHIVGTNGHVMFISEGDFSLAENLILEISGKIPRNCDATFKPLSDNDGVVRFDKSTSLAHYRLISGKFPDFKKIIPNVDTGASINSSFSAMYLALAQKVYGKTSIVKISYFPEKEDDDSVRYPALIEFYSGAYFNFSEANAQLFVMRVKETN